MKENVWEFGHYLHIIASTQEYLETVSNLGKDHSNVDLLKGETRYKRKIVLAFLVGLLNDDHNYFGQY